MFSIKEILDNDYFSSNINGENSEENKKIEKLFFSIEDIKVQKSGRYNYNSLLVLFKVFLGLVKINVKEDINIFPKDMLSRMFITTMNEEDEEDETALKNETVLKRYIDSLIDEYYKKQTNESLLDYEYQTNADFYDSLLNEILHFYYYHKKESYFSAYIHLYRIYEYISYTFPLIFVNNSKNYSESYNELKGFFSGKGEELAFFRVFMQKTFLQDDYIFSELYGESYEISLSEEDFNALNRELKLFLNTFNSSKKSKNNKFLKDLSKDKNYEDKEKFTFLDEAEKKLVISTLDVNDLFISIRNKSCHFKINHSDSVSFSNWFFDDLFRVLNPVFLNWIANIFKYVIYSSTHK